MALPQRRLQEKLPLIVDLDGTVVLSDMLQECLARRIKSGIFFKEFFFYPFWLIRGVAFFKFKMAEGLSFSLHQLPLNNVFIDYIRCEKASGRQVNLVSASTERLVNDIGRQLGCFDASYGSTSSLNLKGKNKVELLRSLGMESFCYAGDSVADLPVWKAAQSQILINAGPLIRAQFETDSIELSIENKVTFTGALLRAMRPHQWLKNFLIFVPLIASHSWFNGVGWLNSMFSFILFSIIASSVYLLNDVLDLDADRLHAFKRLRSIPSGELSIKAALICHAVFLTVGLAGAFCMSSLFGWVAVLYIVLTTAYSLFLKSMMALDVVTLCLLYTLRIVAGYSVTGIRESFWLFCFSGFLFLSLALLKRFSEIEKATAKTIHGRGYRAADRAVVMTSGISSGLIATLVLALYLNSPEVLKLYAEPRILWLILPLIITWILRIWILAERGEVHEDPVVFALKDRLTYGLGLILMAVVCAARTWNA